MSIVGITIKEIKGEVKKPIIGKVKIEHNPKIEDVKETKIINSLLEKEIKISALNIKYSFMIRYIQNNNEVALLSMNGDILYATKDEKEARDLEKNWKKEGNLKGKEVEILNAIIKRGIPKFMYLTEVLSLPPILQIPRFIKR